MAERTYRGSVDTQCAADAAAAGDAQVRGVVWRAVQADTPVAAELERFGAEGVRAMLRAEGQAGHVGVRRA